MTECKFTGKFFGETNQGKLRTNNEDTYICQKIWDENHILCAAIDGLGGYEGGEIAAELARATIIKHLKDFANPKIGDLLKAALIDANNEIIRQHKARPKVSQMGCVASAGIIDLSQGIITIAHVGDSRIYQFVNGELKKLTHDHSLVGYREENGELSEEDAMKHPKRNVIDKFLGDQHLDFNSESYIEISVWPIIGDTQYLFCSDGLTDLVNSRMISETLSSDLSIEDKVRRLITEANDAGGKDNITVVIVDASTVENDKEFKGPDDEKPEIKLIEYKSGRHFRRYFIGFILGLLCGMAGMHIYNMIFFSDKPEIHTEPGIWESIRVQNMDLKRQITELEDSIKKLNRETNLSVSEN